MEATATFIAARMRASAPDRPFTLALSGGSTPAMLYRLLGTAAYDDLPWDRVHLFWGDERYVPPTDEASNTRLVHATLLDARPLPNAQVHPIPTGHGDPTQDAAQYEATLRTFFSDEGPTFDLALQGLGSDGHTASLFPDDHALCELERWALPIDAPAYMDPRLRITLTFPLLNRSRATLVLVAGASKRDILHTLLYGTAEERAPYPAAHLQAHDGVHWFADHEAHPPAHPTRT